VSLTRRKQWKQIRNKETTYYIQSSEHVWPEGIPLDSIHRFVKFLLKENFATWITPAHDIFIEDGSQLSSVRLKKLIKTKLIK
jgi:hypothetical protein